MRLIISIIGLSAIIVSVLGLINHPAAFVYLGFIIAIISFMIPIHWIIESVSAIPENLIFVFYSQLLVSLYSTIVLIFFIRKGYFKKLLLIYLIAQFIITLIFCISLLIQAGNNCLIVLGVESWFAWPAWLFIILELLSRARYNKLKSDA